MQTILIKYLRTYIHNKFCEIYETSKEIKTIKNRRLSNPWITHELKKCCETRDNLYTKVLNNKNNALIRSNYNQYRNKLNKKLIWAKNNYYRVKFIENRTNMRVTWQLINEIIGKKTNNIDQTLTRNFKNSNISNLADNFATKFVENIQKIMYNCDIKTSATT